MGVASVVCRGTVSALLLAVQLLPCAEIGVGGSAIHNKKADPISLLILFCSATRTRTGVYGVRGRCPRPLDDSTKVVYFRKFRCFSKAGAKVLLIFDIHKFVRIFFLFFFLQMLHLPISTRKLAGVSPFSYLCAMYYVVLADKPLKLHIVTISIIEYRAINEYNFWFCAGGRCRADDTGGGLSL